MAHNTKQLLANYSRVSVRDIDVGKLAGRYLPIVAQRKAQDLANEQEYRLNIPQLERTKRLVAEELEQLVREENSHLPVTSVFDALQAVKAHKDAERDAGLRAIRGQLEKMWRKDRTASISVATYEALADHYKKNYPRSAVVDVLKKIGQDGYMTLEVSKLASIASEVNSQADYEEAVLRNGLQGNSPNNVKARQFILALVNGEVDRLFERAAQSFEKRKPEILANVGDINYIDYGGLLVVDRGYGPEGWYIWPPDANPHLDYKEWEVYMFPLDKIEEDSSWVTRHLKSIAETIGSTPEEVRSWLASDDLTERALGYDALIIYFGADKFSNPQQYSAKEIHELFGEEYEEPESEDDEEEFGDDEEDSGIKLSRKAQSFVDHGQYLTLEEKNGGLVLTPTEEGKEFAQELIDNGKNVENFGIYDMLEDFFGNGWESLNPEEVGALTEGALIAQDVERDEDGNFVDVGTIYWDSNYMVQDCVAEWAKGNSVTWVGDSGSKEAKKAQSDETEDEEEFDSEWGKFDSPLAKKLWEASLESGQDEELGSTTEAPGTWVALFKPEKAILYADTQGFISVDEFDDEESLMRHWQKLEKDLAVEDAFDDVE